jgi:hypothetical protein
MIAFFCLLLGSCTVTILVGLDSAKFILDRVEILSSQ